VANTAPIDGFRHFGELNIDSASGDLAVDLWDATGASPWAGKLHPQGR
jgi:alkaline phosphatase D